ncbi:MAG TPA: pentapeptide repeat-containing protein [Methanothrix sp.]|nr:pentapeptide repeat-containing protein [Methanothrix sp.]
MTRPVPALALAALLLLVAAGASLGASEDSRKVVQASEILAAIERGEPVDYDGVIVEGDLNLSGLDLPTEHVERTEDEIEYWGLAEEVKVVESSIKITNSEILGNTIFSNMIFQKQVNFENTNFTGYAGFSGSNFGGYAGFWDAVFSGGDADFNYVVFSGGIADFEYVVFSGGNAFFTGAVFSGGGANFYGTKFSGGYVDFSGAEFSDGFTDFGRAEFSGGDAYFGRTMFSDGDANFVGAEFSGGFAGFWDAVFSGGDADFMDTLFDEGAYFNDAQFDGIADFTSSWFKEDALFEDTTFRDKLYLTRARYDKLFIRWHNIDGKLVYDDAAYLSLLKNFKELGYFEDYDSCYFEYRKERRNQPWPLVGDLEETLIRKPLDLFLQLAYGYGTKPINALLFSLGIIIGFGAFWRSIGLGRPNEALDEYILPDAEHDSILEVLVFSATVFLSGTRLFIEPPPLPKIGGRSRSLIRGAFIFERVLGALFSILFFLAISGTVVRQL